MNNSISQLIYSQHFATLCGAKGLGGFFGLPSWDEYLNCTGKAPELTSIADVWLIVAAVIEILLRVAGILAVFMIIYAGVQYTTSQGNPDQTGKALKTMMAAIIGLVICIVSAVVIGFIAGQF